jgi:hypothetical protein
VCSGNGSGWGWCGSGIDWSKYINPAIELHSGARVSFCDVMRYGFPTPRKLPTIILICIVECDKMIHKNFYLCMWSQKQSRRSKIFWGSMPPDPLLCCTREFPPSTKKSCINPCNVYDEIELSMMGCRGVLYRVCTYHSDG